MERELMGWELKNGQVEKACLYFYFLLPRVVFAISPRGEKTRLPVDRMEKAILLSDFSPPHIVFANYQTQNTWLLVDREPVHYTGHTIRPSLICGRTFGSGQSRHNKQPFTRFPPDFSFLMQQMQLFSNLIRSPIWALRPWKIIIRGRYWFKWGE